jgi:hypothetical protein
MNTQNAVATTSRLGIFASLWMVCWILPQYASGPMLREIRNIADTSIAQDLKHDAPFKTLQEDGEQIANYLEGPQWRAPRLERFTLVFALLTALMMGFNLSTFALIKKTFKTAWLCINAGGVIASFGFIAWAWKNSPSLLITRLSMLSHGLPQAVNTRGIKTCFDQVMRDIIESRRQSDQFERTILIFVLIISIMTALNLRILSKSEIRAVEE